MDVTNLSPAQLRKAAELKERIDSLTSELGRLLGGEIPVPFVKAAGGSSGGRRMSAAGRARIAAAARARWARVRAGKGQSSSGSSSPARGKRTMSAAARAKIAAAARARWAKAKAAGKAHL
jgi:hypothetical protein